MELKHSRSGGAPALAIEDEKVVMEKQDTIEAAAEIIRD